MGDSLAKIKVNYSYKRKPTMASSRSCSQSKTLWFEFLFFILQFVERKKIFGNFRVVDVLPYFTLFLFNIGILLFMY